MIISREAVGEQIHSACDKFLSWGSNSGFSGSSNNGVLSVYPTPAFDVSDKRVILHNQVVGGLRRAFGTDAVPSTEYTIRVGTNEAVGTIALIEFRGGHLIHLERGSTVVRISSIDGDSVLEALVEPPLPEAEKVHDYISGLCSTIDVSNQVRLNESQTESQRTRALLTEPT